MPSTCTFEFDRPDPVYYSGETINGRIVLLTTKPKSVRDISIYCEGLAKVRWTDRRSCRRDEKTETYTVHYRGDETFLSSKTFISGEGILPIGTHVYTFCIPLPLECPTSCVEKYGTISYEIKLNLNRPLRFDNNFVQPLTVLHRTDLNLNPEYLWPLKSEDIKYFCCWPCSSGPVISTLTIPFSGYAPGQDICYKLEIDNQSQVYDLDGVTVKLIQMYTFTAQYPNQESRDLKNTLALMEQNVRCLCLSKCIIEGKLRIPAVPPTSADNGIIQVAYRVELIIKSDGWSINPEIDVPITIGTMPLWQIATQPDSVRVIEPTAPDTPGGIPMDMPPSYDICNISIYFEGLAKVHWTERKSRRRDGKTETYTVHYRGDETYLSSKTFISGEGILPIGTHVYTFCIPLPLECPTSCVEKYGKICYEIKLNLNRPLRFDNNFVQPLTVLHQTDLNLNPEYLWPLKSEDIKYFCCWPCSSGPVISTLTIPFSGYAPGQDICYKLEIDNQSQGYDLDGITVKLIQTYTFTAQHPNRKSRDHKNTLALMEQGDRCLRLSKRIIEGKLRIPAVPPTSANNGIIQVAYRVEMNIAAGCCSFDPEIDVPITIGTIPLWQSATQPDSVRVIEPTAPDTPGGIPMDMPPSYDICKPPSFEEATGIGENFIDTDLDPNIPKQIGWAPKYPMYTNFATPSSYRNGAQNGVDAEQRPVNELRPLLNAAPSAPSVPSAPNAPQGNTMLPYPTMNVMPSMPQPNQRETFRM